MHWLVQTLIAVDQLLNALLMGHADETLSSRAYRADQRGRVFGRLFRPLIDTLFFWQPRHCQQAYMAEVSRRQFPQHFRD